MTNRHPDLEVEQAYIDHAYECLDAARSRATRLRSMVEVGSGGTFQARYERDVIEGSVQQRLANLQLGSASLVFGRIDTTDDDTFHIGTARRGRRSPEPRRRRLAGPGRRALLPGDGSGPDGPAAAAPLRHPGQDAARHRRRGLRPRRAGAGRHPGLRRAARIARAAPHRLSDRHRRHHPGRAGRGDPRRPPRRRGGPGRPRHRQDGGGAAPGRVPALHAPLPARGPGRPRRGPQPAVPALRRAGPAVARRGRGPARHARRPGRGHARRRATRSGRPSRHRRAEGRHGHGRPRPAGHPRPGAGPARRARGGVRRGPGPSRSRAVGPHRGRGEAPLPPAQLGPPVRGGGGVRGAGGEPLRPPRTGRGRPPSACRPAGAGGARVDVAGADTRAAAARPLREPSVAPLGGTRRAERGAGHAPVPVPGPGCRGLPLERVRRPRARRRVRPPRAAPQPGRCDRPPGAPVGPHRRRRGAGPHADGAVHADGPEPQGLVHDRG